MLAGELEPDAGTIERADGLRVVYFEQGRAALDPTSRCERALARTATRCSTAAGRCTSRRGPSGSSSAPSSSTCRVGELSGGEQARILHRPADAPARPTC